MTKLKRLSVLLIAFLWLLAVSVPARSGSPPAPTTHKAPEPKAQTGQSTIDRPIRDKWAVIVGISKFADSSINLRYPDQDATDFHNYLVREGNFQPDHVKLLLNDQATRAGILSTLGTKWLSRVANPDDLVVIYISTHGSQLDPTLGDVNYLVAHDTDKEDLLTSGIAMQDISRIIKGRVHSDRVVMILDACHSGTVTPEGKGIVRHGNINVDQLVAGTGQLVISSSQPDQISWESRNKPNSVFTRHLIDGLKLHGQATALNDAFEYMKDLVQEEVLRDRAVLQTPVLKSKWQGSDLVLAVHPIRPRPGLLEEAMPEGNSTVASVAPPIPSLPMQAASSTPQASLPMPPVNALPTANTAGRQAAIPSSIVPTAPHVSEYNVLPRKLAVFMATGPKHWHLDTKLFGGATSFDLTKDDVSTLPRLLTGSLLSQFLSVLGDKKVVAATDKAITQEAIAASTPETYKHLGQSLGAQFLLLTSIDSFRFDGNVLTGNTYEITLSASLISVQTGQRLWHVDAHRIKQTSWVKDQMIGARRYVQEILVPSAVNYLLDKVTREFNRT